MLSKSCTVLNYSPIVLTLYCTAYSLDPDSIAIFPTFYSVDLRATIHRVRAQSFGKDQGYYKIAKADNIRELSIYLIDSSDMPSISALAKDIIVSFPQICVLNLWFERRSEIVSFLLNVDDYNRT